MINLLAEAGATKINWAVNNNGKITRFTTAGYNATVSDSNYLRQILVSGFPVTIDPGLITQIIYYGAGCGSNTGFDRVCNALNGFFCNVKSLQVFTDIHAAALAQFAKTNGIIAILGTGANAGYYNGKNVTGSPFSVGYLLGDEGSGAHIGKLFYTAYLRNKLPANLISIFENEFSTNKNLVMQKIYGQGATNSFLAAVVPFVKKNIDNNFIDSMLDDAFLGFADNYIMPLYLQYPDSKIIITGGVAFAFNNKILQIAKKLSIDNVEIKNNTFEQLLNLYLS